MIWTKLRFARDFAARYPLIVALSLSLLVHGALFSGWRLGKQLGWWTHQATWLLELNKKINPRLLAARNEKLPPPALREIPLSFVEVDPTVAVPTPPQETKYYGAHNSLAANPDPVIESVVPKVDGQQNKMGRLVDNPKPQPQPLQPALPPEPIQPPEESQSKPKPSEPVGDLAKAKPAEIKKPSDAEISPAETPVMAKERPRTLVAARAQKNMLAGEK